jgi:acyl-CoA thioesterase I
MKKILLPAFLTLLMFSNCNNDATTPKNVDKNTVQATKAATKNILFFGNSLTAGYGLEDVSQGFVQLLQGRIDSLQLPYRCINGGLSGETTAGGKERVEWLIGAQPLSIFVLELGGNDALRGINPDASIQNLQSIIDKVKAKYPDCKIVLAGMEAPRNMGKTYITAFREMYPALSKKNNLPLIPFILDGVGGIKELNQADGIHPTAQGNQIIVETIWKTLKPIL